MPWILHSLFLVLWAILSVSPAASATYYVSQAKGSDSHSCAQAQSPTTGKATFLAGLACTSKTPGSGDQLLLQAGTYREVLSSSLTWPVGTSWANAGRIAAYQPGGPGTPYDQVILDNPGAGRVLYFYGPAQHHLIFEGLILEGTGGSATSGDVVKLEQGAHHIRILNSEIKNGTRQGILLTTPAGGSTPTQLNELIGLKVHSNGFDGVTANDNLNHGLYIAAPDTLVERCEVSWNRAYGIHVYDATGGNAHRNVVRYNYSHHNGRNGILLGSGRDNLAHHNISAANGQRGIQVGYNGATDNRVLHNSVYANGASGMMILASATGTVHQNNLYFGNEGTNVNAGVGTIESHNLVTDPKWINPGMGDFGLQADSPAIDAGLVLGARAAAVEGAPATAPALTPPEPAPEPAPAPETPEPTPPEPAGAEALDAEAAAPRAGGTVRYVAKTGSDSHTCAQSASTTTPKLTIVAGLACMAAGDTLYIRAGTYAEYIKTSTQTIAAGTSWSNPVTIAAYPGETVTLKPNPSPYAVIEMIGSTHKYVIFDGLILDGANVSHFVINANGTAGYNRWVNCEIRNSPSSGILVGKDAHFNEFLKNKIHTNGLAPVSGRCCGYGIYLNSSDNLFAHNEVYNHTGYGIHNYNGYGAPGANRNRFVGNHVHGNATAIGAEQSSGILIGSGEGNVAERNVVVGHPFGIRVAYQGATNSRVLHNTVYGATAAGIHVRASANTLLQNNLVYQTGTPIRIDSGVAVTQRTNQSTDPAYVSASTGDFGLRATSTAIDAGTAISGVSYNGKAPDIGAHETFAVTGAVVPDTEGDNTLVLTFATATAAPLLPATNCGVGFTVTKNGAPNPVTGCTRTKPLELTLTLTDRYLSTDAPAWRYATETGKVTDAALIGNLPSQVQRLNAVPATPALNQVAPVTVTPPPGGGKVALTCTGTLEEATACATPAPNRLLIAPNICITLTCQGVAP